MPLLVDSDVIQCEMMDIHFRCNLCTVGCKLFSCYHCTLDKILLMYLCELTAILLGCCMYIESPFKCGESVRV